MFDYLKEIQNTQEIKRTPLNSERWQSTLFQIYLKEIGMLYKVKRYFEVNFLWKSVLLFAVIQKICGFVEICVILCVCVCV